MTRAFPLSALVALLPALLPAPALSQDTPEALIELVEHHCIAPFPGQAIYDLPASDWTVVPPRDAARYAGNVAIQEAIDYAAFATESGGKPLGTDPDEKWFGLTLQEYDDALQSERDFIRRDWLRLFSHGESGAHLLISAAIYPEDVAGGIYDPRDWDSTSCWLWHPDAANPLNAAITTRWGLPVGSRLVTPLGTLTRHYARVDVKDTQMELQAVVSQTNPEFDDSLAASVLHLKVTDRW